MQMKFFWLLIPSLLSASAFGATEFSPAPFRAEYAVLRDGKPIGSATVVLHQRSDGDWELESTTSGTEGLAALVGIKIVERSRFRWKNRRPELIDYRYQQESSWSSRERSLRVDAGRRRITGQDRKSNSSFAFEPGVMDRHTVALAIAADLARGTEKLSYRVADKGRIESHVYRRLAAAEKVAVGETEVNAVRLERVREKPGRSTMLWLIPEDPGVPARITQHEPDGESIEMRLLRRDR